MEWVLGIIRNNFESCLFIFFFVIILFGFFNDGLRNEGGSRVFNMFFFWEIIKILNFIYWSIFVSNGSFFMGV